MASSIMGDPDHSEGALNFQMNPKAARQDVPGSKNVQSGDGLIGNMYGIGGLKADNGPVMDGKGDEGNERQAVPSPDLQGGLDKDGCAVDLDFGSVAPYHNPDYPSAAKPGPTGFAGSLRGGGKLAPPRD